MSLYLRFASLMNLFQCFYASKFDKVALMLCRFHLQLREIEDVIGDLVAGFFFFRLFALILV